MSLPPITRDRMRKLLDEVLRTDADLEAFCLDFFPDVQLRFSTGMQRIEKVSLLLAVELDLGLIVERLRERHPNAPALAGEPWPPASMPQRSMLLGVAGAAVVLLTVRLVTFFLSNGTRTPTSGDALISTPRPSPSPTTAASDSGIINAQPAAGRIAVQHEGDIHAKGRVNITAPAGPNETLVETKGQIESDGDVNIGVTAHPQRP